MKYKISIIIPIFRVKETILDRCIHSIFDTIDSVYSFEVILVLDGLEGNQWILDKNLSGRYPNLSVSVKNHEGVSAARNYGINLSRGDWIMFVDVDDYLPSNCLKGFSHVIDSLDVDIVFSNHQRAYGNDLNVIDSFKRDEIWCPTDNVKCLKCVLTPGSDQGAVWGKLFNAAYLKDNMLCFDTTLQNGEDQEFLVRAIYYARRIAAIPSVSYCYVYNPFSSVRKFNKYYLDDTNRTLDLIRKDLKLFQKDRETIENIFNLFVLDKIIQLMINFVFHPEYMSNNLSRKNAFKVIRSDSRFSFALSHSTFKGFSAAKRLLLISIRNDFYYGAFLIAFIRHVQLKFKSNI